MPRFFQLCLLICIMQLAACGFHLRGIQEAGVESADLTIAVSAEAHDVSPFITYYIRNRLEKQAVQAQNVVDLKLNKANFNKRIIVLDASAQPAEQLMIFQLDYSLRRNDEKWTPAMLSSERHYFIDSKAIASVEQYEKALQQQLLDQAVLQLRGRIQLLLNQPQ